ncbi:hypothetical protein CR513_33144, partial [Mucuna pruriens]
MFMEEVRRAIISTKSFKAPNLDGAMNLELLETLIVLIPQTNHLTYMEEFHHISLCNMEYKVISKVLVSLLRLLLHRVLDHIHKTKRKDGLVAIKW